MHRPLIEAAAPGDAAAVVELWQACGLTRPWNDAEADFALAQRGTSSTVLIARGTDSLAGSVMAGFDGHRGWIYYLAVSPDCRGAGLGRALMAAAEDWLRARGAPKLRLMVRADNEAALGFYEKLGLEQQPVVTLGRFLKDPA